MIDNSLYEYMKELLSRTPLKFVRYKYFEINWDSRLVGVVGPRGIGKSSGLRNLQKDIIYTFLQTTSILQTIH